MANRLNSPPTSQHSRHRKKITDRPPKRLPQNRLIRQRPPFERTADQWEEAVVAMDGTYFPLAAWILVFRWICLCNNKLVKLSTVSSSFWLRWREWVMWWGSDEGGREGGWVGEKMRDGKRRPRPFFLDRRPLPSAPVSPISSAYLCFCLFTVLNAFSSVLNAFERSPEVVAKIKKCDSSEFFLFFFILFLL